MNTVILIALILLGVLVVIVLGGLYATKDFDFKGYYRELEEKSATRYLKEREKRIKNENNKSERQ